MKNFSSSWIKETLVVTGIVSVILLMNAFFIDLLGLSDLAYVRVIAISALTWAVSAHVHEWRKG